MLLELRENLGLFHDLEFRALDLDVGPGILAEKHRVALLEAVGKGRLLKSAVWMVPNIAVTAPIPIAKVRMTMNVNQGRLIMTRSA